MADDESPLVRDIWISDARMYIANEDSISHTNFLGFDGEFIDRNFFELDVVCLVKTEYDMFMPSSDLFLFNCVKEDEIITETTPVDQLLSNSSFDLSYSNVS